MYTIEQKVAEKQQMEEKLENFVEYTRKELLSRAGRDISNVDACEYKDEAERARDYARRIAQGSKKGDAFLYVIGLDECLVDKEDRKWQQYLSKQQWRYSQFKVVENEIDYVSLKTHRLFADSHIKALQEQFKLGMTARSEKVRADALHQFIQNTRNPNIGAPTNEDIQMANANRQLLDSISNAFRSVAGSGLPPMEVAGERNTPSRILSTNRTSEHSETFSRTLEAEIVPKDAP